MDKRCAFHHRLARLLVHGELGTCEEESQTREQSEYADRDEAGVCPSIEEINQFQL